MNNSRRLVEAHAKPDWVAVSDVYCQNMRNQATMSTQRNTKLTTKEVATRNMTATKTATRTTHTVAGVGTLQEAAAVPSSSLT